jgi:hypothetical protein
MSKAEEDQIVPYPSNKLATRSTALVRRGLDDLKLLSKPRSRVLVISDEETMGEVVCELCRQNGCDAIYSNPVRNGHFNWTLDETIEEAIAFQPDVTLLYNNLLIWNKGSSTCNSVLRLFDMLPGSEFILMVVALPDERSLAKVQSQGGYQTISEIQTRGYRFDILWLPFEKEELLKKIQGRVAHVLNRF